MYLAGWRLVLQVPLPLFHLTYGLLSFKLFISLRIGASIFNILFSGAPVLLRLYILYEFLALFAPFHCIFE